VPKEEKEIKIQTTGKLNAVHKSMYKALMDEFKAQTDQAWRQE
jgi:hypothetical protein